jgi:GDPmannose 4,6-dehydratase
LLFSVSVAKQYAYWILINYREAYGMHLSNGILFNHESPRRGRTFVTRKITTTVARIVQGIDKTLYLGNIDAKRDWGHARDYVEGMWRMLQQDTPDDYVLATGETHTVREFVEKSFAHVGITIKWTGPTGTVDECGVDAADESRVLVKIDPEYFRPTEVDLLLGDPTKAKNKLGWTSSTPFDTLVNEMMVEDLKMIRGESKDMDSRTGNN